MRNSKTIKINVINEASLYYVIRINKILKIAWKILILMLISLNKTYYYENLNMNGIDFTIILNHECKNIFNLE